MAKTEVLIFRHGETDWNRERRLQGHTDIPLNDTGRTQAEALRPQIEAFHPQAIVSSDLQRARLTAEIVNAKIKAPVFESAMLRECQLGDLEGMEREKMIEFYGASIWDRWLSIDATDKDFAFPNGEKKSAHLKRMTDYLESFCQQNPQLKKVAVSTHGGSLRRLIHHCEGTPTEPVPLPNCVLYKVSFHHDEKTWVYHCKVE